MHCCLLYRGRKNSNLTESKSLEVLFAGLFSSRIREHPENILQNIISKSPNICIAEIHSSKYSYFVETLPLLPNDSRGTMEFKLNKKYHYY